MKRKINLHCTFSVIYSLTGLPLIFERSRDSLIPSARIFRNTRTRVGITLPWGQGLKISKKPFQVLRSEIRSIREASFDAEEVQQTINAALGRRGMRRMDRVSQAYYISMEILDGKPPEADEQYGEKLKAVTPQDLERLAPMVFRNNDHLIIIAE